MGSCAQGEECLWVPDPKTVSTLRMEKLRTTINKKYSTNLQTYHDLHEWSVKNVSSFWREVWDIGEIIHSQSYSEVVDQNVGIKNNPKWFVGSKLNFAENVLEKGHDGDTAVIFKGEGHPSPIRFTYAQLRHQVKRWANAMKKIGVEKGDVVAGILPNCPETLFAVFATCSIGAVWTCTSPDYGTTGIVERFKQTEPKVLISVDGVFYNGKVHSMFSKLEKIEEELPSIKTCIVIPFIGKDKIPEKNKWIPSPQFLGDANQKAELNYEQVPFDHPLFIMYSSGTTGKPKCMIHSAGGTLIKHVEEHLLQSDMRKNDVMFYYTTIGWMMYNWLISSLMAGSAIVLYDGQPSSSLWGLIDELGITIFGTSAKWLSVQEDLLICDKVKEKELDKNHTKLRIILSTGSPLKPQSYDFVYRYVKKDVLLGSISGGTDIMGCFMGQNPMLPVHRGEIQSYLLGCDVDCFDEDGRSVSGERGELVVKTPFPSMPTHFHNDADGLLYQKAYFSKFPNVWAHGDFMLMNPRTKGIIMLGRSDATLNPNGVRFGSSEIYQVVESFIDVIDSVCVGQRNSSGTEERVILFLKFNSENSNHEKTVNDIRKAIREQLSPRHVPAVILPIKDIPYTISGKKVEIAVRNVIEGQEVKNKGALANPSSLDLYANIPDLKKWT